jgi:tetratricopeptide (TPR) repeat protein
MGWISNLLTRNRLFGAFSDNEKRAMLDWNMFFLQSERARRSGNVTVCDLTGASATAQRLSDAELDRLIEIRQLVEKADATSGSAAIALYKRIADLAPWDEICLMSIGTEYANAGDFTEAVRWYKKALAANPDSDRVRANLQRVRAFANLP